MHVFPQSSMNNLLLKQFINIVIYISKKKTDIYLLFIIFSKGVFSLFVEYFENDNKLF